MAHINKIETESIQVGLAGAPPIAGVDLWPSMDPTVPFTMQTFGLNNHLAITNQIGLHFGIGAHILTGLESLLGFKTGIGGQANAEPANASAAPSFDLSSIKGDLSGFWKYNGGNILTSGGSDIRLKKNIEPLTNSLDKVLQLQGVKYDWTEENKNETQATIGLIAQDVEKVVPEVVVEYDMYSDLKDIKYSHLTALLIEAVKEQQEQINTLKQTVQELSTKLAECCP
jgi:hypothetical protein